MALASKINNQIENSQLLMQNTMNEMHDKFSLFVNEFKAKISGMADI